MAMIVSYCELSSKNIRIVYCPMRISQITMWIAFISKPYVSLSVEGELGLAISCNKYVRQITSSQVICCTFRNPCKVNQ